MPQTEDEYIERMCNNLHDEISELHEAWREGRLRQPCDKAKKMERAGTNILTCLEEELADIVIRVLDNAVHLNIDIEGAIRDKHAFNRTRPNRHGGKKS